SKDSQHARQPRSSASDRRHSRADYTRGGYSYVPHSGTRPSSPSPDGALSSPSRSLDRTVHDPTIAAPMAINPPTEQGRATRERIVTVAAQLIGERGAAATSLDDVMAATQASKSQL